jgi:hypothetical protein
LAKFTEFAIVLPSRALYAAAMRTSMFPHNGWEGAMRNFICLRRRSFLALVQQIAPIITALLFGAISLEASARDNSSDVAVDCTLEEAVGAVQFAS